MNNINFLSFRKLGWAIAALTFNISRLIPFRNKKLWLYGESSGDYYSCNPKYLFEYACKQDKDNIRHVWITNNKLIAKYLLDKGYEVYLKGSLKSFWLQLRCGVAIYNKSLNDIASFPVFGGAFIVSTWHGAGFKRIYNASYTGKFLVLKKFVDRIFCWTKMDLLTCTSEFMCQQFLERLSITRSQMVITGQPRNDYFMKEIDDRNTVLNYLAIPQNKRIILYLPTYRSIFQGEGIEKSIVDELANNAMLRDYIEKNNYVFVVKLHPLTKSFCIPKYDNFLLLEHGGNIDTQQLLGVAAVLITDYSSCFVDYALLHRPIVFYIPDKDDYVKYVGGMDKEFYEFLEYGCAQNVEELVLSLKKPSLRISDEANRLFYASETGNDFSENVYNSIKKRVLNIH